MALRQDERLGGLYVAKRDFTIYRAHARCRIADDCNVPGRIVTGGDVDAGTGGALVHLRRRQPHDLRVVADRAADEVGAGLAVEILAGGMSIGDLRVAEGRLSVFNGVVHIQVADIQASCAKAKELGGTVPPYRRQTLSPRAAKSVPPSAFSPFFPAGGP